MTSRTLSGRAGRALLLSLGVAACNADGVERDTAALEARAAAATEPLASRLPARPDSGAAPTDSAAPPPRAAAHRRALSPLADSIAEKIVFAPRTQTWFTAAARGKRMLVDLGRVDTEVRKVPERLAAFREAAAERSPVPVGTRLLLRGPFGAHEVTVASFDVWNGRVAGVLEGSALVDSLARVVRDPLPASAQLLGSTYAARDSAAQAAAAAGAAAATTPARPIARCVRDTLSTALAERVAFVRDSLDAALRALAALPGFDAPRGAIAVRASQAVGCFDEGRRVALVVTLRTADASYVQERVVLLDDAGRVTPIRANDLRFKAHDVIYAFDADGDGVDDLAAKAATQLAGATVILRFDPKAKRLTRLTGGFAWESR